MKVKDILSVKGSRVVTVGQDNSVLEAMAIFSANRVGSLLVVDNNDQILGIIAAKDVLMAVLDNLETLKGIKVKEIMSTNLIVGTPEDKIDYIQAVMTESRIRHVPIFDGKAIKGIVSIGDVVKAQLKEKEVENRYLKDYIEGKYPA
ncbi:MAG: CBS domain-containing protein [Bacteroidetes bacterium]|nr:CBS domain-containing protein [Bacteroidota bacterium]